MGIFYNVSEKQSLKDRNTLFKEVGIPALLNNRFAKRPFKTSWFGQYYSGIQGYIYDFARLSADGYLERVKVYIVRGDCWVKIFLNVFELQPKLSSVFDLKDYEGTQFGIPPCNLTELQLRNDDYKGPPIFYMLFLPEHKIGRFYTKSGYEKELHKLKKLIKSDMENIDGFIKRWHEIRKPNTTDWEGNVVSTPNIVK